MGVSSSNLSSASLEVAGSRDRLLSTSTNTSDISSASTAAVSLVDTPLQCLEPYLLGGVEDARRDVGSGSYAVVRELEVKGKRVAGKRLHESIFTAASQEKRDDMLTRFARECKLLQSVKHPNIVRFFGVHVDLNSPLPYLVMEYVDTTLASHLEKNGVPAPARCYNILSDVALGLRYLHEQSPPIIHRDLSANNVLLSTSLQAKISDLGVSKVLNLTPSQRTRTSLTKAPGTHCYMPPEALVDKPDYNTAIDVFSFGVLTIHALCSDWPMPSAPTKVDPSNPDSVLPVTEFERRNHYITKIGSDHPAVPLVKKCIHNSAVNRPSINTALRLLMDLQLRVDEGKTYHPRTSHELSNGGGLAVAIGDSLRVFGGSRKLLKTYSLTSSEVGYVPSDILRQIDQCPVATALYTTTADSEDGLSASEGDSLHILGVEDQEWWYAASDVTGKTGFIPCNYVMESLTSYRWYLGNTSHTDADSLLKRDGNVTGSYLIHDECHDIRCLSVRGRESIMHYRIATRDKLLFISEQAQFKTLQDLVVHYSQQAGPLCTTLRRPYHVVRGDDEVDRSTVRLSHKMYAGKYGEVWKGLKDKTHVVIKILTPGAQTAGEFLKEAKILAQLDHPKIIKCEGVCARVEPVYVLMEFLKYGNLQGYLQHGEGQEVHFLDLVNFALQVAGGMTYLEKQHYIHCDLAARSVAVGDEKVCKIQNFEKARRATSYKLPLRTSVPIRWTAPEVFATNEYTTKADVWAFGVLLHEIVMRGGRPYDNMTNEETLKAVQSGYRMPQPQGCPQGVYDMMTRCWQTDSEHRPRFEAIEWQLEEFFISQCFEDRTYVAPFQIKH